MVSLMNEKESNHATKMAICCSPFQAYVWLHIAGQKRMTNAKILYISCHDTNKDKYYVEQLRKSFPIVEYFVIKGRLWRSIQELNRVLRRLQVHGEEIDLHLASFNTFFVMYIFNKLNPTSVTLFDDGVFSILNESESKPYRYNTNNVGIIRKLILNILLPKSNDIDLVASVCKFYTLFPFDQTITDSSKVESIRLTNETNLKNSLKLNTGGFVRLFIGDVPEELTGKLLVDYKEILNLLPFDYYLPHPRAREMFCPPGKVLFLDVVAEEYISSILSNGSCVTVLSFSSTVLFTLNEHQNLTKVLIRHPEASLPSLWDHCSNYGIQVINYDEMLASCG